MKWGFWGYQFNIWDMFCLIEESVVYGVIIFDYVDIYGNYIIEVEFGEVLKFQLSFWDKMQLVIKCGIKMQVLQWFYYCIKLYDISLEYICVFVDWFLYNLNIDYIDFLFIYWLSFLMDVDLIVGEFEYFKKEGKVCYFGVFNFMFVQFDLFNSCFLFVMNQVEVVLFYLLFFIDGIFDQCQQYWIWLMVWLLLGGGSIFSILFDE